MEIVLVVLGVAGWGCAVVAAFLGRKTRGVRQDTDEVWAVESATRSRLVFALALLGATVGLASTLLLLA